MQIGHREFNDGERRAVHINDDGNQYVYDVDGHPVFGVLLAPDILDADPPVFLGRLGNGRHTSTSTP